MSKIKQGYIRKYGKSVFQSWHKIFLQLDSDGILSWHKHKDKKKTGEIHIKSNHEYFTIGSYCRAIPNSPEVPSDGRLDFMFACPEQPTKRSRVHFFLCDNEHDFNQWISAITSFFPAAPVSNQNPPPHNLHHSAYSPPTNTNFPQNNQPYQPPPNNNYSYPNTSYNNNYPPPNNAPAFAPTNNNASSIGFENLTISGGPSHPPQTAQQPYQPPPPSTYPPPAQPSYPPPPASNYAPPVQPNYAPPPPQQACYPPQTTYPTQYPQQNTYYPQQPYTSNPAQPQYYPQQPTYPYAAAQPQTIVVKEKKKNYSGANLATGVLGGAVAGYAASRMFGGWGGGCGYGGWGMGPRWGSWGSWSSHSWGSSCSFSGGSWSS